MTNSDTDRDEAEEEPRAAPPRVEVDESEDEVIQTVFTVQAQGGAKVLRRNECRDDIPLYMRPDGGALKEIIVEGNLNVNGKWKPPVRCLVDTGAQVSTMSIAAYERDCEGEIRIVPSPRRLVAANGEEIKVLGSLDVQIQLGCHSLMVSVLVAQVRPDLILGMDFMSHYRCSWDGQRRVLRIGGSEMWAKRPKIVLPDEVVIPAQSECLLLGLLVPWPADNGGQVTGIVTGTQDFTRKTGLAVASALALPSEGRVPVRVLNPHSQEVRIEAGSIVGTFEAAQDVEESSVGEETDDAILLGIREAQPDQVMSGNGEDVIENGDLSMELPRDEPESPKGELTEKVPAATETNTDPGVSIVTPTACPDSHVMSSVDSVSMMAAQADRSGRSVRCPNRKKRPRGRLRRVAQAGDPGNPSFKKKVKWDRHGNEYDGGSEDEPSSDQSSDEQFFSSPDSEAVTEDEDTEDVDTEVEATDESCPARVAPYLQLPPEESESEGDSGTDEESSVGSEPAEPNPEGEYLPDRAAIRAAQDEDAIVQRLKAFQGRPCYAEISDGGLVLKALWQNWERLEWLEEILCLRWTHDLEADSASGDAGVGAAPTTDARVPKDPVGVTDEVEAAPKSRTGRSLIRPARNG